MNKRELPRIPFNRPFLTGKEMQYLGHVINNRRFSGDGPYSQWCEKFFQNRYEMNRCLLTTSCTDALEMAALLLDLQPGDEVILPSYTFPSTANAFALRGAILRFADSLPHHPNIDPGSVSKLLTEKTRAIVCVHYAGMACDMDAIGKIAIDNGVEIVEDAALAIESQYKGKQLGTFGNLAAFSFHETKNIHCGEGGMIAINSEKYIRRAEILREKGTNRAAFFRGEIDKYGWMDIGSSFLPGEMSAAFLIAQLEEIDSIQQRRISRWNRYRENLDSLDRNYPVVLPVTPDGATNNGHIFYLVCDSPDTRTELINHLDSDNINAVFHYQSLHMSPYFRDKYKGDPLPNCDRYSDCLIRLPLYNELSDSDIDRISESISDFYSKRFDK